MEKLDFVAVGDITTDAFIELKDAKINCDVDRQTRMLCVRFGDKVPYEDVVVVHAVGNSPNASVSAHRLGLNSAIVTNLGDDESGENKISALKNEGVSCEYIKVHAGKQSNYHYVLRYEAERTILIKHHEYEYSLPDFKEPPTWMYLSSLGENSLPFHHEIATYVKDNNVKLAFQPGTFQIKLGYEKLKDIYEASELFFCNKDEAKKILNKKDEDDIKNLLKGMQELGPKIVVITDGPDVANAYDGNEMWHMPMYPDLGPPVDRTGAGDSFSSTFTSALVLGHDIQTALSWGPINSMNVVQHIGAQKGLLTMDELLKYLKDAPENYVATPLT